MRLLIVNTLTGDDPSRAAGLQIWAAGTGWMQSRIRIPCPIENPS